MLAKQTKLPGVLLITPESHPDFRGDYVQTYHKELYGGDYVEECISFTKHKDVLRGLHADYGCNKLISVFHGAVYYVLVDTETAAWESFVLSGENHLQLYRPAKYAAGLLTLTENVVFHYKQDNYYDPKRQVTFPWKAFHIWWPCKNPILSYRDETGDMSKLGS